ncbi:glycosyltransferase family 1 protein [Mesorhizobium sp.]|uniref:glycosyltransferase family 4 protein n=1 Tax=Mesorhizobium sp. TaxID=1871066 RepID=UPI000FE57251|nr:glycosyltransferase family 1 protein [Mesorhizobium sp.]RWK60430.1 MAG: glycosyltransferase family 1 protein [Mesorhizobium sp.]RWM43973.1 MAG: glycosyltransferase family 1 protein [Mesorhizobium sp.]RWM51833.1 MAG: glycosyltransferase family 1 protein [Mesorhizobium sp.]RWM61468.1 MAG: glycosyltransferase family 1 protein [Mesorhizobium sp.]RWM97321.1 MAG: glycosyltransferase family 1 protein [Mesorhizobium sp.]
MIRVGFVLNASGNGWIGGTNYLENLLRAIAKSNKIQAVILSGDAFAPSIRFDQPLEIIGTRLVQPSGWLYKARKGIARILDRDVLMERFLRNHNIDVLSHSGHLGRNAHLPTITWIPDFQHIRLPEFFTAEQRHARDVAYAQSADASTRIVLSSEDAKRDFSAFRPSAADKARILRFVSTVASNADQVETRESLSARYAIREPFFHLPNQFWAHKNHTVVVDALALARSRGRPLTVVCTGHTSDSRHPDYFPQLMQHARDAGCENDLKVLGLVSYGDLATLMRHSVAVINPSLFEGWSTTVEEAKSLGKTILLSDIPVHREQAPDHGIFFDPRSPRDLADRLLRFLDEYSLQDDENRMNRALEETPQRVRSFSASFEEIAVEAVTRGRKST